MRWVDAAGFAGPEHDSVCAAIDLDDEDSCSCGAHEHGSGGRQEAISNYPRWDPASWPGWLTSMLLMATLVALIVVTTVRSLTD